MPSYLVEVYRAHSHDDVSGTGRRARAAAAKLAGQGILVRYLGAISIPADEMSFYLYEAASAAIVDEAARRASIVVDRVVEAVPFGWNEH